MPQSKKTNNTKSKKVASGMGTIRKTVKVVKGKEYIYYEARYTVGYDPGTGKQVQRSITGKTQKEVTKKLKEATAALDAGTYIAPCKMTVGEWLDIWAEGYLNSVKFSTVCSYKATIRTHLKPGLGAIKLDMLDAHTVQSFYNGLEKDTKQRKALSPKTIKNVHGVLHKALQQAIKNGYIRFNPADACDLPRREKKEMHNLNEDKISEFLKAIKGHRFEALFTVTLFTGMREGEVCGLLWDCVDLDKGTLTINKQLQKVRNSGGVHKLVETKNSKVRTITAAPYVVSVLRRVKHQQLENRLRCGECWVDSGFVFTDELGQHLKPQTVYRDFKKVVASIGCEEVRFHDLRHSYAVAAISSGDDIKTVQSNLGHATAAFTLDIYGHVTEKMKQESAARMERFIAAVNQ